MRIKLHQLAPLAALLLSMTASQTTADDAARFPLDIKHALGTTTIAKKGRCQAIVEISLMIRSLYGTRV